MMGDRILCQRALTIGALLFLVGTTAFAAQSLTVNADPAVGQITTPGGAAWFSFRVATAGGYALDCWDGTLAAKQVQLYGPYGPEARLLGQAGLPAATQTVRLAVLLQPGAYTVKVQSSLPNAGGWFRIQLSATGASIPIVRQFSINNNNHWTSGTRVTLRTVCSGNPVECRVLQEGADYYSAPQWMTYNPTLQYPLSGHVGLKTLEFQVRDARGVTSNIMAASIALQFIKPLPTDGTWVAGYLDWLGDATLYSFVKPPHSDTNWFCFTVPSAGIYDLNTRMAPIEDQFYSIRMNLYLRLYGPSRMDALVDQDDNSGGDGAPRIVRPLQPGVYYAMVCDKSPLGFGDYSIQVTRRSPPAIESFAINNGFREVYDRKITLNNQVLGKAVTYKASLAPDFKNASWKSWSAAPSFTLADTTRTQTVYFKVLDDHGRQSAVTSRSLAINPIGIPLTLGRDTHGEFNDDGYKNTYRFTVTEAGPYLVEVRPERVAGKPLLEQYRIDLADRYNSFGEAGFSQLEVKNAAGGVVGGNLAPGVYFVTLQATFLMIPDYYDEEWYEGPYTLRVSRLQGAPRLLGLALKLSGVYTEPLLRRIAITPRIVGDAANYLASESPQFAGAQWQPLSGSPSFNLSPGAGLKNVYFKVRDGRGRESNITSGTVFINEPQTLVPDGPALAGYSDGTWHSQRLFRFTVSKAGQYNIEMEDIGIAEGVVVSLYREQGQPFQNFIGEGEFYDWDEGFGEKNFQLVPGTYLLSVNGMSSVPDYHLPISVIGEGSYRIGIKSGLRSFPDVISFTINGGAAETNSQEVTLNNICWGAPAFCRAYERFSFEEPWQPYTPSMKFTLSEGGGTKRVYFQVRDAAGRRASYDTYSEIKLK